MTYYFDQLFERKPNGAYVARSQIAPPDWRHVFHIDNLWLNNVPLSRGLLDTMIRDVVRRNWADKERDEERACWLLSLGAPYPLKSRIGKRAAFL